jgi:hypothetical protein
MQNKILTQNFSKKFNFLDWRWCACGQVIKKYEEKKFSLHPYNQLRKESDPDLDPLVSGTDPQHCCSCWQFGNELQNQDKNSLRCRDMRHIFQRLNKVSPCSLKSCQWIHTWLNNAWPGQSRPATGIITQLQTSWRSLLCRCQYPGGVHCAVANIAERS